MTVSLSDPMRIAFDGAGNMYVLDRFGYVYVLAATTAPLGYAMTVNQAAMVVADYNVTTLGEGAASNAFPPLLFAQDIAVDSAGNLVIAAGGPSYFNNEIYVVAASTGTHYGIAATIGHIYSVVSPTLTGWGWGFAGDGASAREGRFANSLNIG